MSLPIYCLDKDAVVTNADDQMKWRYGTPDYSKANSLFEKHKRTDHQPGSLQFIVQNLVKNWEKGLNNELFIEDKSVENCSIV